MSRRRRTLLTVGVLLAIIAAAAAFGIWRMLGDAPEEVSLAEAVEVAAQSQQNAAQNAASAVTTATTGEDADSNDSVAAPVGNGEGEAPSSSEVSGSSDASAAATDELDGTWVVDTETGDFNLAEATGSFAGFRVEEELAGIGAFTAVGRTGGVSGTMKIEDEQVTSVEIAVDLTTLATDDRRRDSAVQRALGTAQHPTATFSLTEPFGIAGAADSGDAINLSTMGDLTVRGITQPVTVNVEAQLVGSLIAVVGSVEITFADFDVTVPQVPIVLSAEDHGIMEFLLLFRRS